MCNITNAQIKVKPDGKVGIGILNPQVSFHVHGTQTKFSFPEASYQASPVFLDRYYDLTRFYPETDDKGYIGLTDKYWNRCYISYGTYDYVTAIRYFTSSDSRLKKEIEPVQNSLEKLKKILTYKYDLDFSGMESEHMQRLDTLLLNNHYGFMAQELMEVYPEMVYYDTVMHAYEIDYISFIPLLVTALQEQDVKIKKLEEKIKDKDSEEKTTETDNINTPELAKLSRNKPNPFNENTTIEYYLPSVVQNAILYIYDLQGKQLKSIRIAEREYGYVTIYGNEMQPGIYHYSLIADGSVVGIEKMILTE